MFKKDEAGGETIIAAGVRVEGDFTSKGRVIIDGEVMGNVKTEDDIHIGEQAKIIANVHARNAIVAGEIKGNVRIKDRLDITSTSKIKGDITASVLTMEAGAALSGKCSAGDVSIQKTKPANAKAQDEQKREEEPKKETPQE
ncbi:MAG: polymer-forming cytoskeletal protein [Patescibacteria group bacterium]|nr:polymer-forming cytoskeletal protein [Patescibacteria group bacterium]